MKVFEYVTDFAEPIEAVRAMTRRVGAALRFTPPGRSTFGDGNPDSNRAGDEFTVDMHPLLFPAMRTQQRVKVVHVDDALTVMDQVSGPLKSYRHETHLSALPGGGTRLRERVSYEASALTGDLTAGLERQFQFRERQMKGDLAVHHTLAGRSRKILIAGASGLIGTQLTALLANAGQSVARLVRSPDKGYAIGPAIRWDPAQRWLPHGILDGVDAVINLSGHSIGGRFTEESKRQILQSRLDATATLAGTIASQFPQTNLIQASAIGIYGARRPGELLTEESAPGDGFLADVVRQWEDVARPAVEAGARVAFLRTGIVLSAAGGALKPQLPLFHLFAGGRMASRNAMTSWVGIDDVVRAYAHAVATPSMQGPVNLVGPKPVTHQEFAEAIGRVLKRPAAIPVPSPGPKVLLGAEGYDQLINTDQNVNSARLQATGFRFSEPTVEDALRHTLMR
ncbi:MAG: TIGR01777 family oxidoreductase [Propionibacteriaceae bacterium]|nr:TIGR01777 family oxidoreductase [Propionibacteriaceae bacterium]